MSVFEARYCLQPWRILGSQQDCLRFGPGNVGIYLIDALRHGGFCVEAALQQKTKALIQPSELACSTAQIQI